jgi:hypothetical protein
VDLPTTGRPRCRTLYLYWRRCYGTSALIKGYVESNKEQVTQYIDPWLLAATGPVAAEPAGPVAVNSPTLRAEDIVQH